MKVALDIGKDDFFPPRATKKLVYHSAHPVRQDDRRVVQDNFALQQNPVLART
jgi:hypothetical protein